MYDADTSSLIKSSPALDGLNRERLPELLSDAFAKIAAARFRLRDGDAADDQELIDLIAEMQRLAYTNEILVAASPTREDRAAAAFVAGSAHQLCSNARRIGTASDERATYVDANGISSDIAAMLLFLVSEATADSGELATRINATGAPPIEKTLIEALRSLARGELLAITSAALPAKTVPGEVVAADVAASALYYRILQVSACWRASCYASAVSNSDGLLMSFDRLSNFVPPLVEKKTGWGRKSDRFPVHIISLRCCWRFQEICPGVP